jgi:hypothetical protein
LEPIEGPLIGEDERWSLLLIKEPGPGEGAKGMKRHEVIIDFNWRGTMKSFRRLIDQKKPPAASD